MKDSDQFDDVRDVFQRAMEQLRQDDERFWNDLTQEQQLMAFCSVVRRLVQAEIHEGRSYRGTLYDTFGFDLDAYARAQNAGFVELHNAIYSNEYEKRLLERFAVSLGVENALEKVYKFRHNMDLQ